MATLTTYSFAKRKNSTALPSGGSQIDVALKDGTSLLAPVFLISASSITFNYCSFEGRYYHVTDVKSVNNGLWEVYCDVDVLATYKSTIGGTTAMILYASGGSNNIIDKRIPINSNIIVHNSAAAIPNIAINALGVGATVLSTTGVGSFGNFILDDNSDLPELLDGVDNWVQAQGWHGIDDMVNQFLYGGSAADCVKNCIGVPFSLLDSTYSGNVGPIEQLRLGLYPCAKAGGSPIYVHRIINPVYRTSLTISIPWEYSDWRRHSPYTDVFLYLPFIGTIALSADMLVGVDSLDIVYAFNLASGDIAVEVSTDAPINLITTASANVAMAMTFGSANVSGTRLSQAIATGIGAVAFAAATAASGGSLLVAGGALFGGVASATSGYLSAIGGDTKGGGGLSGGAVGALSDHVMVMTISKQLTDSQYSLNPLMGKPVMAKHTIQTYSGFVQTDGFEVAGTMTDAERESINSMLDRGIYYE